MTAIRAKQLKKGAHPLVGNEENKEVVMALREIADGLVTAEFPDESAAELEAELMGEVDVAEGDQPAVADSVDDGGGARAAAEQSGEEPEPSAS